MEVAHGPVARRVLASLGLGPDSHYLDLGCGNGYTVRLVSARYGATAVGVDASSEMIAKARSLSPHSPDVSFVCASFPRHSLPERSFDVVFSMESMYYMVDLDEALRAVLELLKPGGVFACAVDFYQENTASLGWPGYVGTDMKLLSAQEWRSALEAAGFGAISQRRVVIPEGEAQEPWHATVGSLLTVGRRI